MHIHDFNCSIKLPIGILIVCLMGSTRIVNMINAVWSSPLVQKPSSHAHSYLCILFPPVLENCMEEIFWINIVGKALRRFTSYCEVHKKCTFCLSISCTYLLRYTSNQDKFDICSKWFFIEQKSLRISRLIMCFGS